MAVFGPHRWKSFHSVGKNIFSTADITSSPSLLYLFPAESFFFQCFGTVDSSMGPKPVEKGRWWTSSKSQSYIATFESNDLCAEAKSNKRAGKTVQIPGTCDNLESGKEPMKVLGRIYVRIGGGSGSSCTRAMAGALSWWNKTPFVNICNIWYW